MCWYSLSQLGILSIQVWFNLLIYADKRGMVGCQNWADKTYMNVIMSFSGIYVC